MAEKQDATGDEVFAKLAHELRGGLAAIRQATQVARTAGASEDQIRWSQDVTVRQVDAMSLLLDKWVAVARPLPVAPAPPAVLDDPQEPPPEREPPPPTGLRVLVADDSRDNADSFATLLAMSGHDVRTAYSGLEAVAVADVFRPQVLLIDIAMPGANGYEVARRIRSRSWGPTAVLIAITGWGHEDDRVKAAEAGFDHHLVKPVDLGHLEPLLKARD